VLIVVIALLTLFAVAGVAFVYYASGEATASRAYREAGDVLRPDAEPELLFAYFLQQLLYGVNDDEGGVYSALRGHELLRNLYGRNYTINYDGTIYEGTNNIPFSGTGRLHYLQPAFGTPPVDDYNLVNYSYFPADGFLRDPERYNVDPVTKRPGRKGLRPAGAPDNRGPFVGTANPSYTYPDLNHLFLAAVDGNGNVLARSFHRDWTGFGGFGPLSPTNPNWFSGPGHLKYTVLRPRPADHPDVTVNGVLKKGFSPPEDDGGDLQNAKGFTQGNDSIWLYLGSPVLSLPDGRRYTMLFAPLIIDLDGKVNLNVHGNVRGLDPNNNFRPTYHNSNLGLGPWEVNLGYVLTGKRPGDPATPLSPYQVPGTEYSNLFEGTGSATGKVPPVVGRYGGAPWAAQPGWGTPGPSGLQAPFDHKAHFYAQLDSDGSDETQLSGGRPYYPKTYGTNGGALTLPAGTSQFPGYPTGFGYGSATEQLNHPLSYNALNPAQNNRAFSAAELEKLYRYGDTGTEALTSLLMRLCPQSFASAKARRQVTTHSFDLDKPAVTPWLWNNGAAYQLPSDQYSGLFNGAAIDPTTGLLQPALGFPPNLPTPPPGVPSEFGKEWRWQPLAGALNRVDVNRTLRDYPALDPTTGRIPLTTANQQIAFLNAQSDRQNLARDIFTVFKSVTGIPDPPWTPGQHDAARWLAQLSVNIVDYVDTDDYSTPFNWNANEWVFGTELPRVVLNEAYVQYRITGSSGGKTNNEVKVWLELHNPLVDTDPLLSDNGAAKLYMPASAAGPAYGIYQILVTERNTTMRRVDNPRGDPDQPVHVTVSRFEPNGPALPAPPVPYPRGGVGTTADPRFLLPANNQTTGPNGGNKGYYLLGPTDPTFPFHTANGKPPTDLPVPTLKRSEMTYTVQTPNAQTAPNAPTILLRRLACPHLPPSTTAGPFYNPYITVDYFETQNLAPQLASPNNPRTLHSVGRRQPYRAYWIDTASQNTSYPDRPQNTFFKANSPRDNAYEWLVHLDRRLISTMELLHVSGFAPHLLTQRFFGRPQLTVSTNGVNGGGTTQTVTPLAMSGRTNLGEPWRIQVNSTLYVDEDTATPTAGQPFTVGETITVTAVGPTASNPTWFKAKFANPHNANFTIAIDPTSHKYSHYAPWFDPDARIYRALEFLECGPRAAGVTAGGRWPGKVNINTIWDIELFDALCDYRPDNHHYGIDQGNVQPLFSNALVGTRTPGGVPRPGDRPFLSLATGTTLPSDNQYPGFSTTANTKVTVPAGQQKSVTVNVQQTSGTVTATGFTWTILPNSWLVIEPGTTNEETVRVTAVNAATGQITATFARSHTAPFAVASAFGGRGIDDTFLRRYPGSSQPWFYFSDQATWHPHPYLEWELATKLHNNVTARSNCFAVWVTVGFFEVNKEQTVVDANGVPAQRIWLGQELGRHRRHRMFAVLDRTVLANHPGPPPPGQPFNPHDNPALVPFFSVID
jgi:hypothetical protein